MDHRDGELLHNPRADIISPHIWHRISASRISASDYETITDIPRHEATTGVPKVPISQHHYIRFFIPGLEELMQAGDKLQASGVSSKLLSRAMPDLDQKLYWQLENTDEHIFSLVTSEYRILSPVREREPRNFDM
jgi:hypothetical protein